MFFWFVLVITVLLLSIFYAWWTNFLLIKRKKIYPPYYEPLTIVIPCYNEGAKYLRSCINSIIRAVGEKEIILVNNNSNKQETLKVIEKYRNNKYVKVIDEPRQGKRFAQITAIKQAKYDLILCSDSDTIFDKKVIKEVVVPFQDKEVGGVTGEVLIKNQNQNFVTRIISTMFWTCSNIHRKATGNLGYMQVMPGPLACYRKEYFLKLKKDYLNQIFLGSKCQISDDRFMTMRVQQRFGKKIVYRDEVIVYTFIPTTFLAFWKMIERWKRGATREVFLSWKEPKKKCMLMFLDTQFNFIMFNIVMLFKFILIFRLIFYPSIAGFIFTFVWLFLMSLMNNVYMVVKNIKDYPLKYVYSVVYEFFWIFTYFHALINLSNQGKWSTR